MSTPRPRSMVLGLQAHERGFTLIEVMVSALLLLIILAGFVPVFLSGLSNLTRNRDRSIAANLAQERIEQIRLLDSREIVDATSLATRYAPRPAPYNDNNGNNPTFRGTTFLISYTVDPTTQPLKQVTVNVSWTNGPVAQSPLSVSTMINQTYLGPRGAWLELTPTYPDLDASALTATPFKRVGGSSMGVASGPLTIKYHVARADFGLVVNDINNPVAYGYQNVYMRLAFVDAYGVTISTGDTANDPKIDTSHIVPVTGSDGKLTDLYFKWTIPQIDDFYGQFSASKGLLPDGYWDLQATMYNTYDQPGNTWQLRVRVRGDTPVGHSVTATPIPATNGWANQVVLTWDTTAERDLKNWIISRDSTPLPNSLLGFETTYTDTGDAFSDPKKDPWGDSTHPTNTYTYSVSAVDSENKQGPPGTATAQMPPVTLVGETTSTTVATTPTTVATTTQPINWYVQIQNNRAEDCLITIKNAANAIVWGPKPATKNTMTTTDTLPWPPLGPYVISWTSPTISTANAPEQSFTLPRADGLTQTITIN